MVATLEPSEANSLEASQTPDTSMRLRRASLVSMGSFSASASAKESESMLGGVEGDWVYEDTFGVGGEVAEGMVYVSITSMRLRVIVAMMGCRLESELIVLKVNFLSSGAGAVNVEAEVRRVWAGLSTQRALSATACSPVEVNS